MVTEAALAAAVGAAGFWLRGAAVFQHLTGRGATTARIVAWALPLALLCWVLTPLAWWWCAAISVALWAGCLPGWWGSLDLGRQAGDWRGDFALHTLRGELWAVPAVAVLFLAGGAWWWLWGASRLCGLVYEVGWRLRPPPDPRRPNATEIGELAFGALLGAGLIAGALAVP